MARLVKRTATSPLKVEIGGETRPWVFSNPIYFRRT